jgi:hypothetical protein
MSNLKQRLSDDMKQAMRDRASVKLNTIRFMLSEIKNFEIDNGEQDDAGIEKLIAREVKSMKDVIVEYQQGAREDLAEAEVEKIAILENYLPKQLSDDELGAIVSEVLSGLTQPTMGDAISAVRSRVGGQADGGRIAALVKQQLA